jgi:anti-anti-sigma factor
MAFLPNALPEFDLTVGRRGAVTTVAVVGELDLATAPRLSAALAEHRDADPLVVDLTGATFIDSTGVRVLVEADRRGAGSGSPLEVLVGEGPVRRVLDLCGLDDRLTIVSTGLGVPGHPTAR